MDMDGFQLMETRYWLVSPTGLYHYCTSVSCKQATIVDLRICSCAGVSLSLPRRVLSSFQCLEHQPIRGEDFRRSPALSLHFQGAVQALSSAVGPCHQFVESHQWPWKGPGLFKGSHGTPLTKIWLYETYCPYWKFHLIMRDVHLGLCLPSDMVISFSHLLICIYFKKFQGPIWLLKCYPFP